jgi:hypothetical protein
MRHTVWGGKPETAGRPKEQAPAGCPLLSLTWAVLGCVLVIWMLPAAEAHLQSQEASPGFAILLLRTIELPTTPLELRQSGAVFFKNFVKVGRVCFSRPWVLVGGGGGAPFRMVVAGKGGLWERSMLGACHCARVLSCPGRVCVFTCWRSPRP